MKKKILNFAIRTLLATSAGYIVFLLTSIILAFIMILFCVDGDCDPLSPESIVFLVALIPSLIVYVAIFNKFSSRELSRTNTIINITEGITMLVISLATLVFVMYQNQLSEYYRNTYNMFEDGTLCYLDSNDDCEILSYPEYYKRKLEDLVIKQQALRELKEGLIDETDHRLTDITDRYGMKVFPPCPEDNLEHDYNCSSSEQKVDIDSRIENSEKFINGQIEEAEDYISGHPQQERQEEIETYKKTHVKPTFFTTVSRLVSKIFTVVKPTEANLEPVVYLTSAQRVKDGVEISGSAKNLNTVFIHLGDTGEIFWSSGPITVEQGVWSTRAVISEYILMNTGSIYVIVTDSSDIASSQIKVTREVLQ